LETPSLPYAAPPVINNGKTAEHSVHIN